MKKITEEFFLGIDQGTQSSRAIVFNQNGKVVAREQIPVSIHNISPQEVEQNGIEIAKSINLCLETVFKKINTEQIKAAGLATQRSSVIAWDKISRQPLSPVISWRDRRASEFVATLQAQEKEIQKKTGLRLTAYYGASKIRWLLKNNIAVQNALREERLIIGPLASFLIDALCSNKPGLVDHANALRTQLFNLQTLSWDNELLELFELPTKILPGLAPTSFSFGQLNNTDIPLSAVNGDQTAAMYGLGKTRKSEVLVNLGTGGFVLCPTDENAAIPEGMLGGLSASKNSHCERLIEGTINGCGAALNWYQQKIGENDRFDIEECIEHFDGNIIFTNGINGLGSPFWKNISTDFISIKDLKITDAPPSSQAVAAIIESIIFLSQININQIKKSTDIQSIRLTGGLANSQSVGQLLANISGLEVMRPDIAEATARGSAWLASDLNRPWPAGKKTKIFRPQTDNKLLLRFQIFQEVLTSSLQE